jgi:hypothetical protein
MVKEPPLSTEYWMFHPAHMIAYKLSTAPGVLRFTLPQSIYELCRRVDGIKPMS